MTARGRRAGAVRPRAGRRPAPRRGPGAGRAREGVPALEQDRADRPAGRLPAAGGGQRQPVMVAAARQPRAPVDRPVERAAPGDLGAETAERDALWRSCPGCPTGSGRCSCCATTRTSTTPRSPRSSAARRSPSARTRCGPSPRSGRTTRRTRHDIGEPDMSTDLEYAVAESMRPHGEGPVDVAALRRRRRGSRPGVPAAPDGGGRGRPRRAGRRGRSASCRCCGVVRGGSPPSRAAGCSRCRPRTRRARWANPTWSAPTRPCSTSTST